MTAVTVPDIGDFSDVPVIEVLVSPGETVAAEDPLVTLESDKATMDVPAPFAGTVKAVNVNVGDTVSEGALLLDLEPADGAPTTEAEAHPVASDAAGSSENGATAASAGPPSASQLREPAAEADTEQAAAMVPDAPVGDPEGPADGGVERRPPSSGPPGPPPAAEAPRVGSAVAPTQHPVYASPAVRRLARELGVDLSGVTGTGRKGRITPDDVRTAASGHAAQPVVGGSQATPHTPGGLDLAPWPKLDFERFGPVERVPRSRIQRISAPNLARNWAMIPHVTQNDEADITDLEAWRKQLNSEQSDVKVTMVSFLIVAAVATLKAFPDFNSSLDGDELIRKRYWNIGFAADTPGGLVVPVIRDADKKGLLEIAAELTELSGRARAGKLQPADISGSTFTISSLGGIGGTSFTPIINAPEVAILGATRSQMKPVWNSTDNEFVPRLMLPLSLSYDHRVIDGAAAARFVAHLVRVLSDFRRVLL